MGLFSRIISLISSFIIMLQASFSFPVLSTNFSFDTPASVFESGDQMYTVIWSTTRPGTGYLTYTYNGTQYTAYDEVGGNILTLDTIHAVRVPKQHIDNNSYTYHSQYVGAKLAYSAVKGKTIDSEAVNFKGYSGNDSVNALILSDIHGDPSAAKKAVSSFEQKPDIVILNGDIVSQVVEKKDFINILNYANLFTNGEIPVAYSRGNHEPRGEYAPEMLKYFRITTGGHYYTFNYGPLWAVVLDSGEDKEDSHPEYSGLVDFKTYIDEETRWLSGLESVDSPYKICIVHKPTMDDIGSNRWLGILSELGIDAAVSGHLHRFDLHFYDGSVPFQRMVTGGQSSNNGFIATMLVFSDNTIRAIAHNEKGELVADELFNTVGNK